VFAHFYVMEFELTGAWHYWILCLHEATFQYVWPCRVKQRQIGGNRVDIRNRSTPRSTNSRGPNKARS